MTIKKLRNLIRLGWLPAAAITVLGLTLLPGGPAWAAPDHQTVPLPTPTDEATAPPQATPTPDRDDSSDDDDGGSGDGGAIAPASDTEDAAVDPSRLTGVVNAVRLNVRSGPGAEFAVMGAVQAGSQLDLLARNDNGTWWLICCSSEGDQGWVSAQFIDPNGLARAEANALLPQSSADAAASGAAASAATPAPTGDDTAGGTVSGTAGDTTDVDQPSLGLTLTVEQSPQQVRQGDTMTLSYQLDNPGREAAINVMLRTEIPTGLTLVDIDAPGAEQAETPLANGATALLIVWSDVNGGASVTADVTFAVADDLPDGSVLDVITAGDADNAELTSTGISVGMPPASLPLF